MIRNLGAGAAMAAVLAMVAGGAEAASAEATCRAGLAAATPLPWRYDAVYFVNQGQNKNVAPRNGGLFDAMVCNMSPGDGDYFQRYYNADGSVAQNVGNAPGNYCFSLVRMIDLNFDQSPSVPKKWDACVWVRYRD